MLNGAPQCVSDQAVQGEAEPIARVARLSTEGKVQTCQETSTLRSKETWLAAAKELSIEHSDLQKSIHQHNGSTEVTKVYP